MLEHVPDQFVTQKMCDEAVKKSPCALRWYKGNEQRKAQKAKIKDELMSVAWHPDRWWNWCVPEHEKKELEIYFALNLCKYSWESLKRLQRDLTLYSLY